MKKATTLWGLLPFLFSNKSIFFLNDNSSKSGNTHKVGAYFLDMSVAAALEVELGSSHIKNCYVAAFSS